MPCLLSLRGLVPPPASAGTAKLSSLARPASLTAAEKLKKSTSSHRKGSKADMEVACKRHKALDKEFARAEEASELHSGHHRVQMQVRSCMAGSSRLMVVSSYLQCHPPLTLVRPRKVPRRLRESYLPLLPRRVLSRRPLLHPVVPEPLLPPPLP